MLPPPFPPASPWMRVCREGIGRARLTCVAHPATDTRAHLTWALPIKIDYNDILTHQLLPLQMIQVLPPFLSWWMSACLPKSGPFCLWYVELWTFPCLWVGPPSVLLSLPWLYFMSEWVVKDVSKCWHTAVCFVYPRKIDLETALKGGTFFCGDI